MDSLGWATGLGLGHGGLDWTALAEARGSGASKRRSRWLHKRIGGVQGRMEVTTRQRATITRLYAALSRRTVSEVADVVDQQIALIGPAHSIEWMAKMHGEAQRLGLTTAAPRTPKTRHVGRPRRRAAAPPQRRRFPEPALTTIAAPRLAR